MKRSEQCTQGEAVKCPQEASRGEDRGVDPVEEPSSPRGIHATIPEGKTLGGPRPSGLRYSRLRLRAARCSELEADTSAVA